MKKIYTIEDVSNGLVAVENDGTIEELRAVLKMAFPEDHSFTTGNIKYYFSGRWNCHWSCSSSVALPTQSVRDFIQKETFNWGDKIEYRDITDRWWPGVFIGGDVFTPNKCIIQTDNHIYSKNLENVRKIKAPKILEVSLSQVADKFGVPVENIRIKE